MLIEIKNIHKLGIVMAYPFDLGISTINGSFGTTYKVIDKQLFFLSVIKYGIEFRKICDLRVETSCM